MNKQQIINRLKDHSLDPVTRETLYQHLHYLTVEGIEPTSAKRPKKNYPTSKPRKRK